MPKLWEKGACLRTLMLRFYLTNLLHFKNTIILEPTHLIQERIHFFISQNRFLQITVSAPQYESFAEITAALDADSVFEKFWVVLISH